MTPTASVSRAPGQLRWAGYTLGFSLGGFFDGILLHQVLQWHHLLSGLVSARQDIGFLMLTDGLFHALMYIVAAVGLWLLWRARRDFAREGADRALLAHALVGFGAWHIVDAVVSHWLLGIHHIRMDADNPLFWDILWLVVFGLVPLVAGLALHRRRRRSALMSAPLALAIAVLTSAGIASLPPPASSTVMVVFRPGIEAADAFAALRSVGGRLLWADPGGRVWAVDMSEGGNAAALYGAGALLVSNSVLPAGCLDWFRA